jgi:hypothetical protein
MINHIKEDNRYLHEISTYCTKGDPVYSHDQPNSEEYLYAKARATFSIHCALRG